MEEIKPLISTNEVIASSAKKTSSFSMKSEEKEHDFFLSDGYKEFSNIFKSIEKNKTYTFVSFGQWSLKHVVFHILNLIGKCDIYSTTYGLGASTARGIAIAVNKGLINSFHFLYDFKIKAYKPEAHDICSNNFDVKVANIHAKVTVLKNENYSVIITGSSNWSDTNDKIEINEIRENKELAEFHINWILKVMKLESTNPKELLHGIQ